MQEHLNTCLIRKVAIETVESESEHTTKHTNKRKQTTLNDYASSFTKQDQEELESLLVRAFCSAGIPFNVVENIDFQLFLQKACPLFQIPSRHTLSGNLLNKEYQDLKKVVRNVFNETPNFCITSDGWSNVNKSSVINYMITTPKPIFYRSVYTKEEHHTGENIAKGIEECMISIGINKFTAVITDNANNMKSAWRILKEKYPDKIFLGCWAHGVNLWVKDIMKHEWADNILEKAKQLALYFRNHQIPLAALRRIQKEKYGHEIALTLTVET